MALSNELLKSFASITNDSNTQDSISMGYGHSIIYNNNVYVILDADLTSEQITNLMTNGDFILDYVGNGAPELRVYSDKTHHYIDSTGQNLIFISSDGGDLYLDKDTYDVYISEVESYDVINNNIIDNKTLLYWKKCCTLTAATPVVGVNNGDRVTTMTKNHKILITGNITNPGGSGSSDSGSTTESISWETVDIDFSTYT